jgi:hypothetical protein
MLFLGREKLSHNRKGLKMYSSKTYFKRIRSLYTVFFRAIIIGNLKGRKTR